MSKIIYTCVEEVKYDGFGHEYDRFLTVKWRYNKWYRNLSCRSRWFNDVATEENNDGEKRKFYGINAAAKAIKGFHAANFVTVEREKSKVIEVPVATEFKPNKVSLTIPAATTPNVKKEEKSFELDE